MRVEFGYCMVCDKETAKKCDSCATKVPTKDFSEVEVAWSNGAKMRIGVCLDCATSHRWATPQAKTEITKAHWDHWDKVGGKYDKEIVIV